MPEMMRLGTISNLAIEMENLSEERQSELKAKAQEERRKRQKRGDGDKWEEKRRSIPPRMNDIDGFKIEMRFENDVVVGSDWYHGTVERVLNSNTQLVRINGVESAWVIMTPSGQIMS